MIQEPTLQFAICTKNDGAEDLTLRKVYQVLPDESAAEVNYVRVVDESGEDYLYPASFFVFVEFPQEVQEALILAA